MEANTLLQITLSGTALDCSELLVGRLYCLTSTKLKMNYSKMLVSATLKQKTNFKLKYSVKINWLMQKVALFKLTKKCLLNIVENTFTNLTTADTVFFFLFKKSSDELKL